MCFAGVSFGSRRSPTFSCLSLGSVLVLCLSACSTRVATQALVPSPPSPLLTAEDDHNQDKTESESAGAEWRLSRRVAPDGTGISWSSFAEAAAHIAAMPRISAASSKRIQTSNVSAGTQPWTSLGPGVLGGRTRTLLIHPGNPNTMYAGAVSGGVWKTTDAGQHWIPLTDGLANLTVSTLVFDPKNPSIIFAGQGEKYDYNPGLGILKSTDAGATWNLLPGTAGLSNFAYVNRVVVSPLNSQRIYAATSTGLLATKDGGTTWAKAPINATFYGCQDLVARSDVQTDYLFAFCSGNTATTAGSVYRNTDAGNAGVWTSVLTSSNMGRSVIALAPSSQSTVYVAAAGIGPSATDQGFREGYGVSGIFRSTSSGDPGSWTTQTSGTVPNTNPLGSLLFDNLRENIVAYCASGVAVTHAYSSWGKLIAVDPLNPNTLWVGAVDLFRSDDGGMNWGVASRARRLNTC